jgi:hypothetical protein
MCTLDTGAAGVCEGVFGFRGCLTVDGRAGRRCGEGLEG